MPRFQDIPQFTRYANYAVDVSWDYLPIHYVRYVQHYGMNVSPDFQRGYVWTLEQKVRYVEFILRGGRTGRDIHTNCPGWNRSLTNVGEFVLVDGKQRLDAVLGFLNNEFPVFGGNYRRDYSDHPDIVRTSFRWYVNDLETRPEVLRWYCDLNAGGTIHSPEEIDRVQGLIGQEYVIPSKEEIVVLANMDREVIQRAVQEEAEREAKSDEQAKRQAEADAASKKGRRRRA
jgi:hypothetical protein